MGARRLNEPPPQYPFSYAGTAVLIVVAVLLAPLFALWLIGGKERWMC